MVNKGIEEGLEDKEGLEDEKVEGESELVKIYKRKLEVAENTI